VTAGHPCAFGDHLTADFNAQSYGGRLESGYRLGTRLGHQQVAPTGEIPFGTLTLTHGRTAGTENLFKC
jgi:hypothetical protein